MTTVYDAPKSTYSDTTNQERIVNDVIQLIDPVDTPLLDALGGLDSARSKFSLRGNGTKIEWLEDEYFPTAGAMGTSTISTNATTLTVADGSLFKSGDVILVDSEYMWVSAVSGEDLTVTRTYGGTNATHNSSSTVSIVSQARLEGATSSFDALVDISAPYNYTSTFQKGLKINGSEMVVDAYGYDDVWAYKANKGMKEMFRKIEQSIFHGIRAVGSATTPRSFGGLGTFITDNSVNAGGAIAKSDIDNLFEYIYLDGGMPDLLVLNPSVANDLRALLDSSSFVRVDQMNTEFGMRAITSVNTQYGSLRLIEDRWCPLSKAYALDSSKIGLYTLRPFAWSPLGKTGDFEAAELVGEISLAVANDKAHGFVYGLTS